MSTGHYLYEDQGALITHGAAITVREAVRLHSAVYDHPRSGDLRYLIIDAIEVIDIAWDIPAVIGHLDRSFAQCNPGMTVVFEARRPDLSTFFDAYAEVLGDTKWTVDVVPSMAAARERVRRSSVRGVAA